MRTSANVAAILACACICNVGVAHAQSNNLGAFVGTVKVSGTEVDPNVSYSATIEVKLPVTERGDNYINAEFLNGEAGDATAVIATYTQAYTEKAVGSDGKYASYKCSLAAPQEIRVTQIGVLNVDFEQNVHTLSLTMLGAEIKLDCVHSHSGPFVKSTGITLYAGTGAPGMHYQNPLPITDASRLAASYTLVVGHLEPNLGPIVQEWDLRLTQ